MKKYIYILSICLLTSLAVEAQNDEATFFMEAGYRLFSVPTASYNVTYTDQSNISETISFENQLSRSSGSFEINAGFEQKFSNRVIGKIALRSFWGNVNGASLDLGIGYSLSPEESRTRFHVMGFVSWGRGTYELGEVEKTTPYVSIGKQDFFSDTISTKLRDLYFAFRPTVVLAQSVDWGKIKEIQFKVGYNLVGVYKRKLIFEGENINEEFIRAKENLKDENTRISIDGQETQSFPIDYKGLFINLGISF